MTPARLILLLFVLLPSLAGAQTQPSPQHSRSDILAAATDIVQKARYCSLVTTTRVAHAETTLC